MIMWHYQWSLCTDPMVNNEFVVPNPVVIQRVLNK
jgi:hypothetical protein